MIDDDSSYTIMMRRRLKLIILLCCSLSIVLLLLASAATVVLCADDAQRIAPSKNDDDLPSMSSSDEEDDDDETKSCRQFFDDGDTCLPLFTTYDNEMFTTGSGSSQTIDDDDDDTDNAAKKDRRLAREFFDVFKRLGVSWGHIIRSYKRIIREASGYNIDGDIYANTIDDALVQLRQMSKDLDMNILSYDIFGNKDKDDLLIAFLNWAATNEANPIRQKNSGGCRGGINGQHTRINVSMAYRRLQVYTSWMKEAEKDLLAGYPSSPLTEISVQEAASAFSMQLIHDECNRLVWWMDLNRTDIPLVKQLPSNEIRRFYIWLAHVMIFDEKAQTNGVVFINSMSDIGFWNFMTILPLELGIKTDEFMICVVPLNTKLVVFLERPKWMNFAYGLLKVFLKPKMRRRVVMVKRKNQQKILEQVVGGKKYIPDGFNGLDGMTIP